MAEEQDQQFVEFVLKSIVDNPDDVSVERTIDEMGVLISVSVNPNDMGKVIGKSGQTAKAVRTLLKVVGAKNDARVNMKIIEPEGGTGGAPAAATQAAEQSDEPVQGTTEAADPIPVDETSVPEAAAEQTQTDAAAPQPSENDAVTDEATGDPQPQEPVTAEDADIPAAEEPADQTPDPAPADERPAEQPPRRDPLDERSPLDEL